MKLRSSDSRMASWSPSKVKTLLRQGSARKQKMLGEDGSLKKPDIPFLRRNRIHDSWHMLRTSPPRGLAAIRTSPTYAHCCSGWRSWGNEDFEAQKVGGRLNPKLVSSVVVSLAIKSTVELSWEWQNIEYR